MTKEQAIDLCRKINELVKRGVGGEQANAADRLRSIMDRFDIAPHDIEGDKTEEYSIICTDEEKKFARQVIASVLGLQNAYKYRRRYFFTCTYSQYVDIRDRWEHYKKLWEQEMEIFYSAFVQKHKLYRKSTQAEKDEHIKPLTPEEKVRLYRMMQMMDGMEFSNYLKKIDK